MGDTRFLEELEAVIRSRIEAPADDSYTARLAAAGPLKLAQKLGEAGWANRARGEVGLVAFLPGDTNTAIVNLGQAIKVAPFCRMAMALWFPLPDATGTRPPFWSSVVMSNCS